MATPRLRACSRMKSAVFLGPSLPKADWIYDPRLDYLPPAARGAVAEAASHYHAILLIDGVFHQDLAPSPKEVFEAVRFTPVFGAASMGALRAVECAPYGAIPLGLIARWYRREIITGDDEVALLFDPIQQVPLTVPLVDVRYWAYLASRQKLLTPQEADQLVERARDVFYMDRTLDVLEEFIESSKRPAFRLLSKSSLKGLDAKFALRTVLRWLRRLEAPSACFMEQGEHGAAKNTEPKPKIGV